MERKDRLKQAFNYLIYNGYAHTQKEVASAMRTTAPNLSSALRGVESVITDKFMIRFNQAYGNIFSIDWLLNGNGNMICNSSPVRINNHSGNARPYFNLDIVDDFDIIFNNKNRVPTYNIDFEPFNLNEVIWCNITGRSLEPLISNGDIIALKEIHDWKNFLNLGKIYCIVLDNNICTVRIVRNGTSYETFRLVPLNKDDYDEQIIYKKKISRIFEIIGCIKRL